MERKPIKIMHLRSSGGFYGAEMVILTIAKELEQMGCTDHIVCINNLKNPHSELIDEAKKTGIAASSVDSISALDMECIKELRMMLKDGGFDVLHCHDYKASLYGLIASRFMGIKRVVTNHGWISTSWKVKAYEALEAFSYNWFDRIIVVAEAQKWKIRPYIVHKSRIEVITNGIDCAAFSTPAQRIKDIGKDEGESKIENSKNISSSCSENTSSFGLHPSSLNCQCANTILRTKLCLREDDFVVGIIGRLSKEKGHVYLLRAFAKLLHKDKGSRIKDEDKDGGLRIKDKQKLNGEKQEEISLIDSFSASSFISHSSSLKLLIVGDGELEKNLKKLCTDLDLDFIDIREVSDPLSVIGTPFSVIFTGVRTDMPDIYKVIDLLAMPSLTEGLPMVLLEAMVSGVPVVATPVGQIPQIVKDGETGFLIEPRDAVGLADVLERIIGLSRAPGERGNGGTGELNKIAANAKKLVIENHSSQAMANKYLETYEWLVE